MCPPEDTVLGPKTDPKMGPRAAQNWLPFWSHFWSNFRVAFGGFWVPSGPQDWPGKGLEEPKRAKWSSERQKKTFKKVVFALNCLHFFILETPQDGPKRPRRLPKSVPRELRSLKKKPPMRT